MVLRRRSLGIEKGKLQRVSRVGIISSSFSTSKIEKFMEFLKMGSLIFFSSKLKIMLLISLILNLAVFNMNFKSSENGVSR